MKQIYLFACILLCVIVDVKIVSAQALEGSDGIPRNLEFQDLAGRPIPIGDHSNILGSPFLKDSWAFGIIKLANGAMFSDTSFNYSLFNDELFLKKDNRIYPVNYPVKEFIFKYQEIPDKKKTYYFKSGFPVINNNDTSTFYEVLFAGNPMTLLKREHKKIKEVFNYSGPIQMEYVVTEEYFVFFQRENKMVKLGPKINANILRKNLPAYIDQIETYTANHKLHLKNDDELIQLFSFLDFENVQITALFIFNLYQPA